jgi:hypothetical protein
VRKNAEGETDRTPKLKIAGKTAYGEAEERAQTYQECHGCYTPAKGIFG